MVCVYISFFFFPAEDGIRDTSVTGVPTCALPICGYRRGVIAGDAVRNQIQMVNMTCTRRDLGKIALAALPAGKLLAKSKSNLDRKSTRLNSSHRCISYAVFCLKKKNKERACPESA